MRRPHLWLYTALLVTIRFSCVRSLWGAFEYTVEECEYNLNEAACSLCAGTRVGLDWRPLPPTCIGHPDGCCKHDGFEYFMKSSLANYLPGHITSYFFPRDDMIFWMGPEPSAGIAPPGRCVWSGDYLVEIARCRIMPAPPPSPPWPPGSPPPPSLPPGGPPAEPPSYPPESPSPPPPPLPPPPQIPPSVPPLPPPSPPPPPPGAIVIYGPDGLIIATYPYSTQKSWGGHSDESMQGTGVFQVEIGNTSPVNSTGDGALDDYVALVRLYESTGGDFWTVKSGWMGGEISPCADDAIHAWQGVICGPIAPTPVCDAGQDCGLCLRALAYPQSECPTDAELVSMANCADAPEGLCEADGECGTSVSLDNCGAGFDVYRKVALPSNLGERRLTRVLLPGNNLHGTLPPHLALATHLQQIELSENAISGTLPSELALLTVMHQLSLSENSLSGTVPANLFYNGSAWRGATCGGHLGISGGTNCTPPGVYLSGNRISGTIPPQLGSLRTIAKDFFCGDGSIADSRPSTDGVNYCNGVNQCPCGPCCHCTCQLPIKLEHAFLHRNLLSGSIPTELGQVELALPPLENPFARGRTTSRMSGSIRRLALNDNLLSGYLPSELGNLTALRDLRLRNNQISGTLPDSVRVNESWPNSHGVRGPGGHGVPSELGFSSLRLLSLENNILSGSVPPSLVPCVALVDLHRSLAHNLLSGSTPQELAGHTGAQQRFHSFTEASVFYEGADIPEQQRLRRFRVDKAAVDAHREPSFEVYESRDACLWSPNVLLRCAPPNGALGRAVSYSETGGIRRCDETFQQPAVSGYTHRVALSREFNHRVLTDGESDEYETRLLPGETYEWWRRPPYRHEREEHNTPTGLAGTPELPG